MEESKLVLDSSVLIKWFSEENDTHIARKIKTDFISGKYEIHMPLIYLWEINNYLSRFFDFKSSFSILSNFKAYSFKEYSLDLSLSELAFNIVKKHQKVSFYDASFHALAIREKATFVTSDKKYYEKTKKLGHIRLLSEFN